MIIGLDGNEANSKNRVGSGQYSFELLKKFSQIKNKNFLVYLKNNPLPDMPGQSSTFKYKIFGPKKFWTQFALPIHLVTKSPSVFFSMGHYAPRFSRVPTVITIHDLSYLHFPDLFKKNDLYQLKSWTKYSIEKAAHIIAVSKTTKEDVIKSYKVEPAKISVTYEGYDEKRFKPQKKDQIEKTKKKYQIVGDYIIFVGTIQPRKNLERLIEAFSHLKLHIGNLKLVICGKKGWLYDPILKKVKDLNLEEKVIFTDYVPDDKLPLLIAGSKAYVLPSLWEGFGIPVIEAQACKVPVIVSNTSSLPEIVANSGLLIDPSNSISIKNGIEKILNDEELSQQLTERGLKNIKRFSWSNCANQTLSILEKVASK